MVFSNAVFLFLFLPLTLLVYYSPICKNLKVKNIWLLLASLFFYAWGEPVYVLLMIASITANYFFGKYVSACPNTPKGKCIVAVSCIFNLGVLFVFKYLAWILRDILGIAIGETGIERLALPIGISFYTFQALSYVIDVYRGKEKAQTNILNVGLYIAFFPQLIAGPIVRYGTISKQLKERTHSISLFAEGVRRFIVGLSKKLLLANTIAVVAQKAFALVPDDRSVLLAWAGAIAFMLQLYFDFSGYSDMAIGLGKMFGFEFLENFNYPYISKSISEYWRRWHISLGEWFRDYLFYPLTLGPSVHIRKKIIKKAGRENSRKIAGLFVLFVVWMSTGIWHGANLTFVIWGFTQFICIGWETYRKPWKKDKLHNVLGYLYTFLVIIFTKVLFYSDTLTQAVGYYGSMLGLTGNTLTNDMTNYLIGQNAAFFILGILFCFPVVRLIKNKCEKKSEKTALVYRYVTGLILAALLFIDICYAVASDYNPFIYFNF